MSTSIVLAILVTSLATFLSRFLGAVSSEGIKETSKIFKWFNCLAYATLAALIARTIIFPVGVMDDSSYLVRFVVVVLSLTVFFISKKITVYIAANEINILIFKYIFFIFNLKYSYVYYALYFLNNHSFTGSQIIPP